MLRFECADDKLEMADIWGQTERKVPEQRVGLVTVPRLTIL